MMIHHPISSHHHNDIVHHGIVTVHGIVHRAAESCTVRRTPLPLSVRSRAMESTIITARIEGQRVAQSVVCGYAAKSSTTILSDSHSLPSTLASLLPTLSTPSSSSTSPPPRGLMVVYSLNESVAFHREEGESGVGVVKRVLEKGREDGVDVVVVAFTGLNLSDGYLAKVVPLFGTHVDLGFGDVYPPAGRRVWASGRVVGREGNGGLVDVVRTWKLPPRTHTRDAYVSWLESGVVVQADVYLEEYGGKAAGENGGEESGSDGEGVAGMDDEDGPTRVLSFDDDGDLEGGMEEVGGPHATTFRLDRSSQEEADRQSVVLPYTTHVPHNVADMF